MANYDGQKMGKSVKSMTFSSNIDALSRSVLRFTRLNGRNQGKIHGRGNDGFNCGSDSATIDDVLHAMGCDLFGGVQYKITIQAEEIKNVKREAESKKKEEEAVES